MVFLAIALLAATSPLHAQTNGLPALLPPYGELPPTFWEQHGTSLVIIGLGLIVLLAFGLWSILRPKPKPVVPPEAQARQALERLRQQPEDGIALSCISQVVRNYFIAAFQLPPGEFTTAEFSRAISDHEPIGAEISAAAIDFLRDCDARKFSAADASTPFNAVNQALNLVEQAEQRRPQLRPRAETQTPGPRA